MFDTGEAKTIDIVKVEEAIERFNKRSTILAGCMIVLATAQVILAIAMFYKG